MSLGLFEDPLLLLGSQRARLAFIGAHLGRQSGETAFLVSIPPILEGEADVEPRGIGGEGVQEEGQLLIGRLTGKSHAAKEVDFGEKRKNVKYGNRPRRRSVVY